MHLERINVRKQTTHSTLEKNICLNQNIVPFFADRFEIFVSEICAFSKKLFNILFNVLIIFLISLYTDLVYLDLFGSKGEKRNLQTTARKY